MKARAYRYLPIAILGFALLVVLSGPAAADESAARRGTASTAVLPFQAAIGEVVPLHSEEKPSWMKSLAKAACHSTTACDPSIYGACASWSGYSDCDDPFCGSFRGCGECEEFPCPGPAMKQWRERFRVCFDQFANPCTEWQRTLTVLDCGC